RDRERRRLVVLLVGRRRAARLDALDRVVALAQAQRDLVGQEPCVGADLEPQRILALAAAAAHAARHLAEEEEEHERHQERPCERLAMPQAVRQVERPATRDLAPPRLAQVLNEGARTRRARGADRRDEWAADTRGGTAG